MPGRVLTEGDREVDYVSLIALHTLKVLHKHWLKQRLGEVAIERRILTASLVEQIFDQLLLLTIERHNTYPTGVEVCGAMVHGGPYPATSDARGTSVGSLAIDCFLRPVCYQNYPQSLLPEALLDGNPLGLRRLVNGQWSDAAI
ncbi:hypothetical protein PF70_01845 [Pseudomonas asplenii]|nr:hypothetical protein PF70_01845 [Pseudomonas fuscovaginae]